MIFLLLDITLFLTLIVLMVSNSHTGTGFDSKAKVTIIGQNDGSMILRWPGVEGAKGYEVLIDRESVGNSDKPVFTEHCTETECNLPNSLSRNEPLRITVRSYRDISLFGHDIRRDTGSLIETVVVLKDPAVTDLVSEVDMNNKIVNFSWKGYKEDEYFLYELDEKGEKRLVKRSEPLADKSNKDDNSYSLLSDYGTVSMSLSYNDGGDISVPDPGNEIRLLMLPVRSTEQMAYYGSATSIIVLNRDYLLSSELKAEYEETGTNSYRITWNETKGDGYDIHVREKSSEEWVLLRSFSAKDERVYETGVLDPGVEYKFRVSAFKNNDISGQELSVFPSEIDIKTKSNSLYSTIWPTKALEVYTDTQREEVIGKVKAGRALCVLEERDDMFKIRIKDGEGFIDSNYCMINLPEYMGDLCKYDITNAYSSLYLVHEYTIPNVSGTVIPGYENVLLGDGTFIVPLLYPVAKKLVPAANKAIDQGYRILIYDSFRPYVATRYIYDTTNLILDTALPDEQFKQISLKEYLDRGGNPQEPVEVNTEPALEPEKTYRYMMTNNVWKLSSFLAQSGSNHNLGIAMDMTLTDIDTGEELLMQSRMHDLSFYSVKSSNNEAADKLKDIMVPSGFNMISSEWWHFQDDDTKTEVRPPRVEEGVSIEGFKRNDKGWRYRQKNGEYITSSEMTVDGVKYIFDEEGYTDY
ncbi:MAG: hypothetical protein K6B28_13850 [Lachnospiraceae bacterium]|nr:hypothetical protein [Lachnospiraceae bacterium]